MALGEVFRDLEGKWDVLQGRFDQLSWSVTQVKPPDEEHALAVLYEASTTDLLCRVEEAKASIVQGRQTIEQQPNLAQASHTLMVAQERFNQISQRLWSGLSCHERMKELADFGLTKGGAWRGWADRVKEAIEECRQSMDEVNQSLFRCWQEIVERVGMTSVSVQATNIGQQVTLAERNEQAR